MGISIRITEKDKTISGKIADSVSKLFNSLIRRKQAAIIKDIRVLIYRWVNRQPEMQDILAGKNGILGPQLGINAGEEASIVHNICTAAASAFSIDVKQIDTSNFGTVKLNFGNYAFTEFLELPDSTIVTEKGEVLNWMDWILKMGSSPIVIGYRFAPKEGKGRSGGGIMIKKGVWSVPERYTGLPSDNFITRALLDTSNMYEVQQVLMRHLK
jgi:hypothetical protein